MENYARKFVALRMACIFMSVIIIMISTLDVYAQEMPEETQYNIMTVKTGSNMRSEPNRNGAWVMAVPRGALVVLIESDCGEYSHVQYGKYDGYLYEGSLKHTGEETIADYLAQFPDMPYEMSIAYIDSVRKVVNLLEDGGLEKMGGFTNEAENHHAGISSRDVLTDDNAVGASETANEGSYTPLPAVVPQQDITNNNVDTDTNTSTSPLTYLGTTDNITVHTSTNGISSSPMNTPLDTAPDAAYEEMAREAAKIHGTVIVRARIRAVPSIESEQIASVNEGESVIILDAGDNGYTHILYDGTEGYIYSRCLSYDESLVADGGGGIIDTVVVDDYVSSGNGASGNAMNGNAAGNTAVVSDIGVMQRQALAEMAVGAMNNSGPSSAVIHADTLPAVSANTLTADESDTDSLATSEGDAQNNAPGQEAQSDVAADIPNEETDTSNYNNEELAMVGTADVENVGQVEVNLIGNRTSMRSLPDGSSNKIMTLPIGTDVTVIGASQDGYTLVQYNGLTGYVLSDSIVETVDINRVGGEPVLFQCTAYCSCKICCGSYSPEVTGGISHTSTGTIPEQGRTIAVDPSVIPYGSHVYIEGMGTYTAEDCGGAIQGNHIDIYFESHEDAVNFGNQRLYISIVD